MSNEWCGCGAARLPTRRQLASWPYAYLVQFVLSIVLIFVIRVRSDSIGHWPLVHHGAIIWASVGLYFILWVATSLVGKFALGLIGVKTAKYADGQYCGVCGRPIFWTSATARGAD